MERFKTYLPEVSLGFAPGRAAILGEEATTEVQGINDELQ